MVKKENRRLEVLRRLDRVGTFSDLAEGRIRRWTISARLLYKLRTPGAEAPGSCPGSSVGRACD
jgi:hypothetical protein